MLAGKVEDKEMSKHDLERVRLELMEMLAEVENLIARTR
jgi:hypothetical protein